MVCTLCGHPNDAHQYVSSSLFYCNQCKVLESHVAFSQDAKDPSKSDDALTELYNAFRR